MGRALTVSVRLVIGVAYLCLASLPLGATTYVQMSDEAIADQATVIAQIEIVKALEGGWSEPPVTEYLGIVQRVLKGRVEGSTITVRVPGGVQPDGLELHIPSVPVLEPRDKALLFLTQSEGKSLGILHWALGQ